MSKFIGLPCAGIGNSSFTVVDDLYLENWDDFLSRDSYWWQFYNASAKSAFNNPLKSDYKYGYAGT
jgi:hypothetical protein